jgi:hypothetical protein
MATDNQATFPGFQFPNTTQIPNEVFDTLMPHLSGGELKVLLYICRRTFGFCKDSDSISLTQIAHGITTRAGRVLDQGTGLSKRQVQRALRVLESRNVIRVERRVDETGLHEINTYRLNVLSGGKMSPPVETLVSGRVGTPMSPGVETSVSTTKQREQKKDSVVDVAQALQSFGITQSAATHLMQHYPAAYIREKLAMAQGLVASGSCLVSQNPADWLRRAIEEDYRPPRTTERQHQRSVREKKDVRVVRAEPKNQHLPKEEPQQTQTVPTEKVEYQQNVPTEQPQNVATHNRENMPENKEPEKTSRENQATWELALKKLKADLPLGEAEARLTGTTLIEVTDTKAKILVPNHFAVAWFERRLYGQICKPSKG